MQRGDRTLGMAALVVRILLSLPALVISGVVVSAFVRSGSGALAVTFVSVIGLAVVAASLSWVPNAVRAWRRGGLAAYAADTGVPQPAVPPRPPSWRPRSAVARLRRPSMFLPDGSAVAPRDVAQPWVRSGPLEPGRARLLGGRQIVGALLVEAVPVIWLAFALAGPHVPVRGSRTVMGREYAPGDVPGWSIPTVGFLMIALVLQLALLPLIAALTGVVGAVWGEPTANGVVISRRSVLTWRVSMIVVSSGSVLRVDRVSAQRPDPDSTVILTGDSGRITAWLQQPYGAHDHARLRDWCAAAGVLVEPEYVEDVLRV